jgi:hypothetical protein
MVTYYSPDTVELKQEDLGNPEFAAIGRLIRACADIEDLVTLAVADLMGSSEAAVVVALGQTPISKKLAIGNYLAGTRDADWVARFAECFGQDYKEIIVCRNAVAHGVLVGRWADGRWAFLTARTEPPLPGATFQQVISFKTQDLNLYAGLAEELAKYIEQTLGLATQRKLRHGRSLLPHRRSQPKPKQGAKRKRPPRSSKKK